MIVITGASDGLGLQLAKLYSEAGKVVVNVSRRESEYATHNILVNLREGSEIQKASDAILALGEPLEAIVNCAAVMSIQPLGEITEDEIKRVMSTNLKSAVLLVSNMAERIKADGADIVNVASTVGTKGYIDQAVYGASKWAMRGFSANLQVELKDTNCRVISFCTGGFESKIFEKATGITDTLKSGEWMKPEDVALFMKQILDLPKNMEVSEVIINRRNFKP
jgi:NADP-dependent 3-hydroxy acid dehydrogenase YdfG